jgi:urease subunit gamma/beta
MMNLTPTELERLVIFNAAEFARRNRARGILLSHPEAVALIADEMLLAARAGMTYEAIVDMAANLLTTDDVMLGVAPMVTLVSVEAAFEEGTKMIVVFNPIGTGRATTGQAPIAGEIICPDETIEINAGRARVRIDVINTGDRDIQVRSHSHFFEVNRVLEFDREKAFGKRLDVPSGTGIRFEPGVRKSVDLVEIGGTGTVRGQANLTDGSIHSHAVRRRALEEARRRGYRGAQ